MASIMDDHEEVDDLQDPITLKVVEMCLNIVEKARKEENPSERIQTTRLDVELKQQRTNGSTEMRAAFIFPFNFTVPGKNPSLETIKRCLVEVDKLTIRPIDVLPEFWKKGTEEYAELRAFIRNECTINTVIVEEPEECVDWVADLFPKSTRLVLQTFSKEWRRFVSEELLLKRFSVLKFLTDVTKKEAKDILKNASLDGVMFDTNDSIPVHHYVVDWRRRKREITRWVMYFKQGHDRPEGEHRYERKDGKTLRVTVREVRGVKKITMTTLPEDHYENNDDLDDVTISVGKLETTVRKLEARLGYQEELAGEDVPSPPRSPSPENRRPADPSDLITPPSSAPASPPAIIHRAPPRAPAPVRAPAPSVFLDLTNRPANAPRFARAGFGTPAPAPAPAPHHAPCAICDILGGHSLSHCNRFSVRIVAVLPGVPPPPRPVLISRQDLSMALAQGRAVAVPEANFAVPPPNYPPAASRALPIGLAPAQDGNEHAFLGNANFPPLRRSSSQ